MFSKQKGFFDNKFTKNVLILDEVFVGSQSEDSIAIIFIVLLSLKSDNVLNITAVRQVVP